MTSETAKREYSSFRDPCGVIFSRQGVLYRQVNKSYLPQWELLNESGLYEALVKAKLMVPVEVVDAPPLTEEAALVLKPRRVPFISYPYEWCFGQYKDAALTTLRILRLALKHGMVLKDASAYNIQFLRGRPRLIDTLSFEEYQEGSPWGAYGQFCRHFLAPLMLMCYRDVRLSRMMASYIDGIPLDLASSLLKGKGGLAARQHIHLHAKMTDRYAEEGKKEASSTAAVNLSKNALLNISEALTRTVQKLELKGVVTEWGDYYNRTNYTQTAAGHKGELVSAFLAQVGDYKTTWDLGANDGRYSRLALQKGKQVVAFDIDPVAVERNYTDAKKNREALLPLVLDLTNPSPGIGFAGRERQTIAARQQPDVVMMLAVIHHLAISNNLPLEMVAQWTAGLSHYLIIEFVPKEDSQVALLLKTRADIFPQYHKEGFEAAFLQHYRLLDRQEIQDTHRTLYLLESKDLEAT